MICTTRYDSRQQAGLLHAHATSSSFTSHSPADAAFTFDTAPVVSATRADKAKPNVDDFMMMSVAEDERLIEVLL